MPRLRRSALPWLVSSTLCRSSRLFLVPRAGYHRPPMPKEGRDRRRHRSADPDPAPKPLLARILDTPNLARAVPQLQPELLHRLIDQCGLEDCAELVALATPAQLSAVFDLDLWSSRQPGEEERFDADRFGVWLEVLLESGAPFAAGKLAAIDPG